MRPNKRENNAYVVERFWRRQQEDPSGVGTDSYVEDFLTFEFGLK